MRHFASSFADESDLLIVSHLSQKYYVYKLILKINDEKRKIVACGSYLQNVDLNNEHYCGNGSSGHGKQPSGHLEYANIICGQF